MNSPDRETKAAFAESATNGEDGNHQYGADLNPDRDARDATRQYDQRVEPLGKQVEKLRHNLVHDLGHAIAFLGEVTKTLAEYTEMSPATSAPKLPPETAAPPSAPDGGKP